MAVMPSNPCFRLVHVKLSLTHKICSIGKIVLKMFHLKVLVDFEASKLSAPFSLLLSL